MRPAGFGLKSWDRGGGGGGARTSHRNKNTGAENKLLPGTSRSDQKSEREGRVVGILLRKASLQGRTDDALQTAQSV